LNIQHIVQYRTGKVYVIDGAFGKHWASETYFV